MNLPHDQKYWTGAGFAIGCVLTGTYHNVIVPLCKVKLDVIIINSVLSTVDENIIGAPKMRNNYGAIQLFIFQYSNKIFDFSLLILVK